MRRIRKISAVIQAAGRPVALAAVAIGGLLVSSGEARIPDIIDPQPQAPPSDLAPKAVAPAGEDWKRIYYKDFEDYKNQGGPDASGWTPFNGPGWEQPSYWQHVSSAPPYNDADFEPGLFTFGPLDGQEGWQFASSAPFGPADVSQVTVAPPPMGSGPDHGNGVVKIDRNLDSTLLHGASRPLDIVSDVVTLGIDVYIESASLPSYWVALDVGLEDTFIGINVQSWDRHIIVVFQDRDEHGNPFPVHHDTNVSWTTDQWHRVEMTLNFTTRTVDVWVDGLSPSPPIFNGTFLGTSDRILNASFSGQFNPTNDAAYYDNFQVDDGTPDGFWWCGTTSPHFKTVNGYGNDWNQALTKTFTGVQATDVLEVVHQYNVEPGYDFCSVEFSWNGGFYEPAPGGDFTGQSAGFETWNCPVGQTGDLTVRFHFVSDMFTSPSDGFYAGAGWKIRSVGIGSRIDDFQAGEEGWSGSAVPAAEWATFRLDGDPVSTYGPPQGDFGHSWVAYDDATGTVPAPDATPHVNPRAGIVSPVIPLPVYGTYDQLLLDMTFYRNLPLAAGLGVNWSVISRGGDSPPWPRGPAVLFGNERGWYCSTLDIWPAELRWVWDITPFIADGATGFQLLLSMVQGTDGSGAPYLDGAYFDNVQVIAVNSSTGNPVVNQCPIDNTPAGTDVEAQPADLGEGDASITITFETVTEPGNTVIYSSPVGPPLPAGYSATGAPTYYYMATTALTSGSLTLCDILKATNGAAADELFEYVFCPGGPSWLSGYRVTINDILCAIMAGGSTDGCAPSSIGPLSTIAETNDGPIHYFGPFVAAHRVSVEVSGFVTSDCAGPLAGVTVDLDLDPTNPVGDMLTTTTGADGSFLFTGVPASTTPGEISVVSPLGFSPVSPQDGHAAVALDDDRVVDFALACQSTAADVRGMGYWKHQANVYLKNKGSAHESQADMETTFPEAIFSHFHENALNSIEIEGVTFMDPAAPRPLTLAEMQTTLTVNGGATAYDRARQHDLVFLLNIASGKIFTHTVVSADGANASQAVQHVAALLQGSDPAGHEQARDIAEMINEGVEIPAGMIPLDIDYIAYSRPGDGTPRKFFLAQNQPNPFASGTTIQFGLPDAMDYHLTILSVSGRLVRRYDGTGDGPVTVVWDGRDDVGSPVAAGIYFYRIEAGGRDATRRMLLVR